MRQFLLCSLLWSCTAALLDGTLASLLLLDRYGNNNRHNRRDCRYNPIMRRFRCRRDDNDDDLLLLVALLNRPPVCYPDYATFERQTATGFETIPVKNLTLGDKVKCLRAPFGPETEHPELGVCRYTGKNHDEDWSAEYVQVYYEEGGEKRMMALSPDHILWSSRDQSLQGSVNYNTLNISDEMFVPAGLVRNGDVIVILDVNNVLQYRTIVARFREEMQGVRNPSFSDGGLPIVNGVLSTTSASSSFGGHWGSYFKKIWKDDAKFADPEKVRAAYKNHPLYVGVKEGSLTVDDTCFLKHVIGDMKKGVDVSNFDDFDSFAQVYLAPCTRSVSVPWEKKFFATQ